MWGLPHFETRIWPHMFYMSADDIWRWKMNVARVMGNSCDRRYTGDLIRALKENPDARVRAMAAWALGKIGGETARAALLAARDTDSEAVAVEAALALGAM